MIKNDIFFQKNQTALTKAKVKVYEEYIKGYLPKLLIQFNSCLIADLFSGAGKSGKDKGSPLILIEKIEYILTSSKIQEKQKDIIVMYNDYDKKNIEKLKHELENINYDEGQIRIICETKKFEDFLLGFLSSYKYENSNTVVPKFIFLDPYKYSDIKMNHLRSLMNLKYTEVLLFLPIFHTYRFAKDSKLEDNHKTRIFLKEFTTKGVHNYDDVYDFMDSIREKLKGELDLKYVRPLLLDAGSSKNSLFLLTKHRSGMLLMNTIADNLTNNQGRNIVDVNIMRENRLFTEKEIRTEFSIFKGKLILFLKEKKELTNSEIIEFTIQEGLLPKHAKDILKKLKSKIKVYDIENKEIKSITKWNIAKKINKTIFFKWEV